MSILAFWVVTAVAGFLVCGLVRSDLRLEERISIAGVFGMCGGALCNFAAVSIFGMHAWAVIGAPLIMVAASLILSHWTGNIVGPWVQSGRDFAIRWRAGTIWPLLVITGVAIIGFSLIFAHTLFEEDGGGLSAGFANVWADWSVHATTATSFTYGPNIPPHNPLFAGLSLLYPFMPDFQSATLQVAGMSLQHALAIPGAVMCVAIVVLAMSLAHRLAGSYLAGALATLMSCLGGGLGFVAIVQDSCTRAGFGSRCDGGYVVHHLNEATAMFPATLFNIVGTITAQPHSYDSPDQHIVSNVQWYTPLFAWWLPQRPFLFGFAIALCVLLLVMVGWDSHHTAWAPFVTAGIALGVLPIFHIHSFIAMAIVLPFLAWRHWRREWLALAAATVVVAAPRLIQILSGVFTQAGQNPTGTTFGFAFLEPGWLSGIGTHIDFSILGLGQALATAVTAVINPKFWGFWLLNTGVITIVTVIIAVVAGLSHWSWSPIQSIVRQFQSAVHPKVAEWCLPFTAIFVVANIVVFQPWDWDNTKVFSYWYFGIALALAVWVVRWWRSGFWRASLVTIALLSVVASGSLTVLRTFPWTPAQFAQGPFQWASADDRRVAAELAQYTRQSDIFVTPGRPNDPVLTLAGRTTLEAYPGWLWSYGIDAGQRPADIATIYAGCPDTHVTAVTNGECRVTSLLHHYNVSYVEIDDRQLTGVNVPWWRQHFAQLVTSADITIYEVHLPLSG